MNKILFKKRIFWENCIRKGFLNMIVRIILEKVRIKLENIVIWFIILIYFFKILKIFNM